MPTLQLKTHSVYLKSLLFLQSKPVGSSGLSLDSLLMHHIAGDDEKLQDLNHDARSIGSVGEIEVRVERRTEGVVAGKKVVKEDGLESKHPSMVHERALKGQTKSHGVS